jgi:hypothetical protein
MCLVVSFFVVSLAGVLVLAASFVAFFFELQLAAIDPIIAAINTKLKMCFFIKIELKFKTD